jgi:hypothetical protein
MPRPIAPTDTEREPELGRVALWLDADDLRWLGSRCACSDDASDDEKERCARIRFRAHAALHKAGLKDAPDADAERETP